MGVTCQVCKRSWDDDYPEDEDVITVNAEMRGMLTVCLPCLGAVARRSVAVLQFRKRRPA